MSLEHTKNATVGPAARRDQRFLQPSCAVLGLCLGLLTGGSKAYAFVTHADSPDFTVNTAGIVLNVGGASVADSANFSINTLGLNPDIGGAAHADSGDFRLNTVVGTPLAVGGASYADSANFAVSTRFGTTFAVGGASVATSANFTLNTVFGTPAAIGGVVHADSADFTVSTRFGLVSAVGGARSADSADFTVNTTGVAHITNMSTALGIIFNGSTLNLSWAKSAGDFSVQATTNLNPPNWITLSNPPATVGTNFVATVSTTNPVEFFRLKSN